MAHIRNMVAALAILSALACVALVIHAGNRINHTIGPSALAVDAQGRLHVASHGKVHAFDAAGIRIATADLEALGAPLMPSDIAVLGDGRLLLADAEGPVLVRCDTAAGRCERVAVELTPHTREHLVPGNAFKVFADEAANRLYLSDNGGHRLVIADLDGRTLEASPARRQLHFPNKLWISAPDRLSVVDTNHHRIATFDVFGDRVGPLVHRMGLDAKGVARPGRIWPFAAAVFPDGGHWALLARNGMKDADVVVFGEDGKARRRIDLGDDSDPFAIVRFGERAIVADATNYRLQAISADGKSVADFGDAQFRRELEQAHEVPRHWKQVRLGAQAGVVVAPLFAIFLLWRLGVPLQRPQRQPIPAPAAEVRRPLARDVRWLEIDTAFIARQSRLLRRLALMVGAAVAAMMAVVYLAGDEVLPSPKLRALAASVVALSVAVVGLSFWLARRLQRRTGLLQLGASAAGLHFRVPALNLSWSDPAMREGVAPWADVHFDGRRLLAGRELIVVKPPLGEELFARDRFSSEILAHVPRDHFVSPYGLEMRALRAGNRVLVASWISVALILAIIAVRQVLR